MITAEEHFKEYFKGSGYTNQKDLIEWGRAYALEIIKADRENVAEHAKTRWDFYEELIDIDKDSIINAPQIELK